MNLMYKPMGVRHSNWQLSQNNQYVSYALLSWVGSIVYIDISFSKIQMISAQLTNRSQHRITHPHGDCYNPEICPSNESNQPKEDIWSVPQCTMLLCYSGSTSHNAQCFYDDQDQFSQFSPHCRIHVHSSIILKDTV